MRQGNPGKVLSKLMGAAQGKSLLHLVELQLLTKGKTDAFQKIKLFPLRFQSNFAKSIGLMTSAS